MSDDATSRSAMRTAWWLLTAAIAVRLALAASLPLFPDEAYYWEWSRRLAAGYFDHPPAIAWLIRAGTMLFGDTRLGVRLGAVLCGALAGAAVLLATRRLAGAAAARDAAWLAALLPLFLGAFVLATPDAPLLAFGACATAAAARAVEDAAPRWWLVTGVCVGLALLSKFTAVLLPLGFLVACASTPALRAELRRPWPWLAGVVALAVALPLFAWNASHDWTAFRFQFAHGLGAPRGRLLDREADYLGGQVLLASPLLLGLFVAAAVQAVRSGARAVRRLLACVVLVTFAFFAFSATRRRPEANWPALAYPAAIVLLASSSLPRQSVRTWRWALALAGAFCLALVLAATPLGDRLPPRLDPFRQARGWGMLADSVSAFARRSGMSAPHVAANRYQDAAMLAWHLQGHPDVHSLNVAGRRNQYELWAVLPARITAGDAVLLVLPEAADDPPAVQLLREHFDTVEPGPLVPQFHRERPVRTHRLWLLRGWRGSWPGLRDVPAGRPAS